MKIYTRYDFLDFNGNFKFDNFLCVLKENIDNACSKYYDCLLSANVCDYNLSNISSLLVPLHFLENLSVNLINCSNMNELDVLLLHSHSFLIDTYSFDPFYTYSSHEFEKFYFSFLQTLSNFDLKNAKEILNKNDEYIKAKDYELLA